MSEPSSGKAISITYFDPFDLFESVKNEFSQIIPFENIHWKGPSGIISTINRLDVKLEPENKFVNGTKKNLPFIKFIILGCNSVEEYRSKVRPLLRQWLPEVQQYQSIDIGLQQTNELKLASVPMIFFYSNSGVVDDSNLFKSVSIMDKFNKDFPDVQTLELKSVYKSLKAKEDFWNQLGQRIKSQLLEIFQQRLNYLNHMISTHGKKTGLSKQHAKERLYIMENIFDLYFSFNLLEEGNEELNSIKTVLTEIQDDDIPHGILETPFNFKIDNNDTITNAIKEEKLTKFFLLKYFFIREFSFLELEENINSKFLRTFKQVRQFLQKIEAEFQNDMNLLIFKYEFIDSIIRYIPKMKSAEVPVLSEIKAELILLKRDCWLNGVLSVTNYQLINKNFGNIEKKLNYKFDIVKETYEVEDQFYETFIEYNKELLKLFNQCGGKRQRIIDIISLEVGMIHHQRKEYKNAVSLLISCYEYYCESNWDLIGFNILKVFADSLENCPKLENIELDGSSVEVSSILCNSYLNIIKLSRSFNEKQEYYDKFLKLHSNQINDMSYTLNGLMNVDVNTTVSLLNPNTYSIKLNIDNFGLPVVVQADYIKLILRNNKKEEIKVDFTSGAINISKGINEYTLISQNIKYGQFILESLEISIHGAILLKEFADDNKYNEQNINSKICNSADQLIEIFEICSIDSISVNVEQAKSLELGENALEVDVYNFSKIKLPHLSLQVLAPRAIKSFTFANDKICHSLEIDVVTEKLRIPYYLEQQITSFSLEVSLTFEKTEVEGIFSETKVLDIECYLPVSVSVEDIFKKDIFFFRFLLSSSLKEEPIILHSSKLTLKDIHKNDKYDILGDFEPDVPLVLSSIDDSCLNCYRLKAKDAFDNQDIFNLRVRYNTLKEQIDCLVTDYILVEGDVEWFKKYYQLKLFWKNMILSNLKYDNESFTREKIIKLVISEDEMLIKKLNKLIYTNTSGKKEVTIKMLECLDSLTKGVHINELDITEYTKNLLPRELIVPVDLPDFEQFYHIDFSITGHNTDKTPEVGKPIQFDIKIENMGKRWGCNQEPEVEHIFEIMSSNDWLLQGKKRFTIPSTIYSYTVTLIPLKKGHLTMPTVEINSITGDSSRIDITRTSDSILVL